MNVMTNTRQYLCFPFESEPLNYKWLEAVEFLRTESRTPWLLDRQVVLPSGYRAPITDLVEIAK